ncbi:hypothetical protein [Stenotrophobium rhamnosiphilum]|uniref:hypothetical protein n=1 Tax=Stenotrophobium rhamnosiphilum TaxID=2029166 RepID=UPI0011B1FCE0|nr:hypothetical protein [Stenotrophobium rhamnosiphilum]
MHHQCPACGVVTAFERRRRTFAERVKTLRTTYRPHQCTECDKEIMIDVHSRDAKDIWLGTSIAITGLVLCGGLVEILASVIR